MAPQRSMLETLRDSGALKEGHFVLSSGRHSDRYIEKFDLLRQPRATSEVCGLITKRFQDRGIDVVVGPTTGGVILAFEVGRQLGIAAAYAERAPNGGAGREFRRGTTFPSGARALVVDDILTTGGSLRETLDALAGYPVEVAGVAVLVDRSGGRAELDIPYVALETMDITTWDASECPLCSRGQPVLKPGTTPSTGSD